ncbi:protein NUP60 [Kluyveromyces marxianus]|uniref:Protein NUP60 n=1 Tax=Kluyveromyces marxianus TaxID=4911 RepID=A0ABX6EQN1_KLUMA|nr:protein NUP60 [Kluyveromyces marxianus]
MSSNRKSYIVRNSIAPYKKPSNSIVTRNTRTYCILIYFGDDFIIETFVL